MIYVKRLIVLLLSIYTLNNIVAQVLEIPEATNVSVNRQSQLVEISWKMKNTAEVDGYIIKRKIFGQPNVVDGSLNTVATISNNNQFFYIDSLDSYGYALPTSRVETYRVVSYKNVTANKVLYSNMSNEISTIFLSIPEFNLCERHNKLLWTQYNGFGNKLKYYNIYCANYINETPKLIAKCEAKDTSFVHTNIEYNRTYYYHIEAVSEDSLISLSNMQKIETTSLTSNCMMNADYATVIDKNSAEILFTLDKDAKIKSYILYKSLSINGKYDTLKVFSGGIESINYTDVFKTKKEIRYYTLAAINECEDQAAESNVANNIILKAKVSKEKKFINQLSWNKYEDWRGGVKTYCVYRSIDGANYEKIADVSSDKNIYDDNIHNLISNNHLGANYQGKFCYYIQAEEDDKNPYGIVGKSKSNVSCAYQEAIVYLPNAINPKSSFTENRTFRPISTFVSDYQLIIYNRWGGVVFKSNDPLQVWDAKTKGGDLLMRGTYVYYLQYKSKNKKVIKTSGEINVIY